MRTRIPIATLVLVALLAAAPLWGPGIVNTRGGGDSPFLLQRTHQMVANLRAGVFPVRWMPDAAYGLGYPFFSYYAALPYYLAGLLVLLGLDILSALKLVQTLGFVAAALAMYGWMRGVCRSRWAAWLAAVAYTVAPFHLVNVYVRGDSLSEFYAFVFYPLILWAVDGIGESANQRISEATNRQIGKLQVCKYASMQCVAVALAYAGLLLTHNISAFVFTPFALLYLWMRWFRKDVGHLPSVVCHLSFVIGFLLSAWFWLPAVAELDYVQLGPSVGVSPQDYFHYSNHFRALDLVQWTPLFDYSVAPNLAERSPFAMGLVQAVCAALGALSLLVRRLRRKLDVRWGFVLLGLLISTAMITPLSKPLWDHLPLLPVVQFPWRFLSVQALFAAAATASLAPDQRAHNTQYATRYTRWVVLPIAVLLVASVLLPLHPDRLPIGPADVTVERLQLYELFTQNIGTTIRYEWLPRTVNPRPFTSNALIEPGAPGRATSLDGASLEASLLEQKPTQQTWQVRGEGGRIAFPLLYWPGWGAQVDGEPVAVWPVEGSGYLTLEVPPGEHTVLLRLGRTMLRAVSEVVSLVTAVALLVIAMLQNVDCRLRIANRGLQIAGCRSFIAHCSLLILPLLVLLLLPRGAFDGEADLTMDFVQMPYLHHNPDGVLFGSKARLSAYNLSSDTLAPGDTLTMTLDWSHVDGTHRATLRLVSPAAVRHEVEPLAEAVFPLSSGLRVPLSLPADTPRGIYLVQLEAQGTSEYLRPVRVPHGPSLPPDISVLAAFGPAIRLHTVTVAQLDPHRLAVRLAWSAAQPVAANYGVSLRLLDADGQLRIQEDSQPGYGFLPTSLWRPGELIVDRYVLALPDDLPPGAGYDLQVVLYQVFTLETLGQALVGDFALPLETETPFEARRPPRSFILPDLQNSLEVDFGAEVRLAGYDLEQGQEALRLTLWWQALQAPQADYTVFVHLFDPLTQEIPTQSDTLPQGGMYPTSWWAAGEVVSETVTLPLEGVPQGTYQLAVGLYDRAVTRLQAVTPDGQRLPDDRLILPAEVRIGP